MTGPNQHSGFAVIREALNGWHMQTPTMQRTNAQKVRAALDSLEEQLEARQKLIEDIHAWFQGLAAEEGDPVFEIAERVEAFAVSSPASEPEDDGMDPLRLDDVT